MPISSFYGLQTTLRGLLAQQRSIDVTGHNIANASTPGFSRQEAALTASPALQIPAGAIAGGAGAHLGSGVDVQAYRRIRDQFVDVQYRAQSMRLGQHTATAGALDRVERSLAEPGDTGITAELARFWNAWADVANHPEDAAARQALVEQASALAGAFATVDGELARIGAQASAEYAALTAAGGEVDVMARELAALNGTISGLLQTGDVPNDLLDRRDLLLDRLCALAQVSVVEPGDGTVTVTFGDAAAPLVAGSAATWPQALTTPGGRLGALKALGDPGGTIDTYRAELSAVARALADGVNALHASGGGPAFFTYAAGAEAASLAVAVAPAGVVTSTGTAPGANDVALAIAGMRAGTIDGAYRSLVTRVGTDVREATRERANAEVLAGALEDRRQSVSGVSLDEEMTNLVRFQRAYQASARAMSSMDEMLEQLIMRTGRVGL